MRVLEVEGWHFHNFPQQISARDYQVAREEFIRHWDGVEGLHAIYRFGSVTYPGLSDLDFLVVLDDAFRPQSRTAADNLGFSVRTRYVLYHPQFVIPRRLFQSLPLLIPIFEMELVAGRKCKVVPASENDLAAARTFFLSESFVADFAWSILGFAMRGKVDLRMAQARLNLVVKNASLLREVTGVEMPWQCRFEQQVRSLRKEWFQRTPEANCRVVRTLLIEACDIVSQMAQCLDRFVEKTEFRDAHPILHSPSVYRYEDIQVIFELERIGLQRGATDSRTVQILSSQNLALPLFWFAAGTGPVSRFVRGHFDTGVPRFDLSRWEPLERIVAASNDHCQFLRDHQILGGHFRYFGYKPSYRPGVRTLARKLVRKTFSRH